MLLTLKEFNEKIFNQNLTGYIWRVSERLPNLLKKEKLTLKTEGGITNLIQEAYLSSDLGSFHIKNIDGKAHFFYLEYKSVESTDDLELSKDITKYPSHLPSINKLHFKHLYSRQRNVYDEDFYTWQPIAKIFVGFE